MQISNRVQSMHLSPIRKFNPIAIEQEEKGKKIYHLNIGQPDIETPSVFMDAIRDYDKKVIAYGESGGLPILQDAVIDYFHKYGADLERKHIIVTTGGSEALQMAFLTLLNEGDDVLIPEPFYSNYHTFAMSAGGNCVPVVTSGDDGYKYADMEKLEKALTPRTKAICVINPGNPTGCVLTEDEMKTIAEFAKKHDLFIFADEVYREFVYDGRTPYTFLAMPDIEDRLVVIDSISKRFSCCGGRVGFLISKNEEFMGGVMKLAQGRLCTSTITQVGAAALYRLPEEYYTQVRDEYCARRDAVYEELQKMPGFDTPLPGGAFYLTCKLPVDDVEDLLMFLLKDFEEDGETVMYAPAAGFYGTPGLGRDEIRIAYVLNQDAMRRGCELLTHGVQAYLNR